MLTREFDYELPPELIAQHPAKRRDASRLLVVDRATGRLKHHRFSDLIEFLGAGDVMVVNNSKVIPARLRGVNLATGGRFEFLLLEPVAGKTWRALVRPGKRARAGVNVAVLDRKGEWSGITALVQKNEGGGHVILDFAGTEDVVGELPRCGEVPLPPYIARVGTNDDEEDRERYQTVYAQAPGSVAAPTAGLHFTGELLERIRGRGVAICEATLHAGFGTFAPVKVEDPERHQMHEERFELSRESAAQISAAKANGGRVIAVGTTSLRVLETVGLEHQGHVAGSRGRTKLFVRPPWRFQIADALLTNFHLPRSTLLMLVCAFASPGEVRGRELILGAYGEAIRERYRFFSYGDAMLIL